MTEGFDKIISPIEKNLTEAYLSVIQIIPQLIGAFFTLLLGWIVAICIRKIMDRLTRSLDSLMHTGSVKTYFSWSISEMIATITYWLVLFFFFTIAIEVLGFSDLSDWLRNIYLYLPHFIAGAFILLIGMWVGDKVNNHLNKSGVANANILGKAAFVFIVCFAVIVASTQIGIDTQLLVNILSIIVTCVLGGAALAFGLGASNTVSNIMASHYLKKMYIKGDKIKSNQLEGEIVEIGPVSVLIVTHTGRVRISSQKFADMSLLSLDS